MAALISESAKADTAFTSFAFSGTGSTASRTTPARLADMRNVKEFGAVGDGVADDTTAIQNAINQAALDGNAIGNSLKGGTVYFPPGTYKVSTALNLSPGNSSGRLIGAGGFLLDTVNPGNGKIFAR